MRRGLAHAVALAWGLGEATVFFIVPDVWLTTLALARLSLALEAAVSALAGALLGGAAMAVYAAIHPDDAIALLYRVPAIGPALIARVHQQVGSNGLWAVALGPTRAIPYKIFAVDWGARGGDLLAFVLVSVPARGVRFVLSPLVTAGGLALLSPLTHRPRAVEVTLLVVFWIALYAFYFSRFGW